MTADTEKRQACVMGSPIAHSLSPKLHGFWLKQYDIDGRYTAQEVTPGQPLRVRNRKPGRK